MNHTFFYSALLLSVAFIQTAFLRAADFPLVTDGKSASVIVISKTPSGAASQGAEILRDHIRQITGAELPIIRQGQLGENETRSLILIGKSSLAEELGIDATKLGPGEIVIRSFPEKKKVVLLGADHLTPVDPNGSVYAVTTFLEDQLGVRFLWPGELGKVVPKTKSVAIGEIDHRFAPTVRQRQIRMFGGFGDRMARGGKKLDITEDDYFKTRNAAYATQSKDGGWARWQHLGGSLRLISGHSFGSMWEKYKDSHPEWFAMAPNGSRDQSNSPDRSRLCVSNEALIEQIAKDRIAKINQTGQKSVPIGPNDGGKTTFCMCENCKKLDPPEGRKVTITDFSPGANRRPFEYVSLTDRYVHFFNGIAERVTKVHPDVWLTADAYSLYSAPPVKAKLHPNIAIRYVGVSYSDETRRHRGLADWVEWSKSASKIYFRSNLLLAGRRQGTPMIYVHKLAEDFPKISASLIGTDLDSCCHNWATQGLNYYAMAKLLWNPDLDIDALIDDYCRSGFGSGAEDVKRYFHELEKLTNLIAENEDIKYTDPYTDEIVAGLRKHLEKADQATRDEKEANQRVAFLRAGLDYTDAYCEIFRVNRDWQDSGAGRLTPEFREKFKVACDANWKASRHIFDNHFPAVNVTYVAWGSWDYFGRFGWRPPPLVEEEKKKKDAGK